MSPRNKAKRIDLSMFLCANASGDITASIFLGLLLFLWGCAYKVT